MNSDSNIIIYTTWSLNNESTFNKSKPKSSIASSSNKTESLSEFSLNREFRSFCCVFKYLTCKSCKFHSLKVYLVLLSLMALFTSMIQGGYMSAVLTSLQTQFNMSTSKIGIILSSFDIMGVFATPLVSYFGSRYNKAKIIAVCSFLYAFGSIVFTFPYFFGERYSIYGNLTEKLQSNLTIYDTCKINNQITKSTTTTTMNLVTTTAAMNITCDRNISDEWPYYLFIIGQLLMSWGIAPLFSLGITYLTENSEEKYHAVYTGNF